MSQISFADAVAKMPLVAIIRGVKPTEVLDIATALKSAGFIFIEVPLNSPDPYQSIQLMADNLGEECIIGAGTVTSVEQAENVHQAGGRLIVSPNTNTKVIQRTKQLGMISIPGFYTPSEAFTAIEAGADGLKMFPSDTLGTKGLKAIKVVLPPEIPLFAVGGVNAGNIAEYLNVGATGFGLGSGIYKPAMAADQVYKNAKAYVAAYKAAQV
ncbi:MAG: 2-dehydro-3-deoxy-6-phosphogalactonate aldolase [Hyphomicrobiales bacterium]